MQLHVTEVMNHVEIARTALVNARNQLLQSIYIMSEAGHNTTDLIRMQERLDEAIALSQTSHDHLGVWQRVESQRKIQCDLDSYQGDTQDDEADSFVHQRFTLTDYSIMRDGGMFGLPKHNEYDASADEDLPYYGLFGDGEEWPQYGLTGDADTDDDDDSADDEYDDDLLDRLLATEEQPVCVILGDERAHVAFDTSDMTWADQPLHDEEYRQLFGLPLTPGGDWHYDIFGNWHPGRHPSPLTDGPDYNTPW